MVPLKSLILLGPISLYNLMGVFPWAFILHILLALADSYWILFMNTNYCNYAR
jgi:hypothetical protein